MRVYSFFLTATLAFIACVDASSTMAGEHEPPKYLRNDAEPYKEERTIPGVETLSRVFGESSLLSRLGIKSAKDASKFDFLNAADENPLRSQGFVDLVEHIKTTLKPGEELYTKVAKVLVTKLGTDRFARMMDASSKADDTKTMAISLQVALVNTWSKEKRPLKKFRRLFPKIDDDLLRNPLLSIMAQYVKVVNPNNHMAKFAEILETRVGTNRLVTMLGSSGEGPMVKLVRQGLVASWEKQNPRKSVDEMFNHLLPPQKLAELGDDLLSTPHFDMWFRYAMSTSDRHVETTEVMANAMMKASGKVTGAQKDWFLVKAVKWLGSKETKFSGSEGFQVFYKHAALYEKNPRDQTVARMLEVAKSDESFKDVATRLQLQLFEKWHGEGRIQKDIKAMLLVNTPTETLDDVGKSIMQQYYHFWETKTRV